VVPCRIPCSGNAGSLLPPRRHLRSTRLGFAGHPYRDYRPQARHKEPAGQQRCANSRSAEFRCPRRSYRQKPVQGAVPNRPHFACYTQTPVSRQCRNFASVRLARLPQSLYIPLA
jgi:hypothetical protein